MYEMVSLELAGSSGYKKFTAPKNRMDKDIAMRGLSRCVIKSFPNRRLVDVLTWDGTVKRVPLVGCKTAFGKTIVRPVDNFEAVRVYRSMPDHKKPPIAVIGSSVMGNQEFYALWAEYIELTKGLIQVRSRALPLVSEIPRSILAEFTAKLRSWEDK